MGQGLFVGSMTLLEGRGGSSPHTPFFDFRRKKVSREGLLYGKSVEGPALGQKYKY